MGSLSDFLLKSKNKSPGVKSSVLGQKLKVVPLLDPVVQAFGFLLAGENAAAQVMP